METREDDRKVVESDRKIVVPGSPAGAGPADAEPAARKGPPRRVIFGIVGVVVLVIALIWGIPWVSYSLSHQGTDDARVDSDVIAVTSKIPERINQILVETNQEVHKGQLLVVLDNKDELARLQQAQAQYDLAVANQRTNTEQNQGGVAQASGNTANAQAQVPVAMAGVAQADAQMRSAQALLPAAEASYQKAQADYARTQSLVSTGDEPAQQLDAIRSEQATAVAQLHDAQNQINVAEANADAARNKVSASSAGVAAAEGSATTAQGKLDQASDPSNVESAKAQLDLAKQNLTYTRIYSPIDGYVGEKNAQIGQVVSAGLNVMTLIPHHIFITANYKETQMGGIVVGQPADIGVDAYKGHTFHGHVTSINPASQNTYALVPAQNATGNFVKVTQRIPVRISVDDQTPDLPLRPGMSVEANVKVK
jgi:membrane fusion protein, multidrug efflux system